MVSPLVCRDMFLLLCGVFVFVLVSVVPSVTCCYDKCIQNFTKNMETISQTPNSNSVLTADFCRAMSTQIQCLQSAMLSCPQQQKSLVENLLSFFIQPDYNRTCSGNATSELDITTDTNFTTPAGNHLGGTIMAPAWGSSYTNFIPTNGQMLLACRQNFHNCQNSFNQTFTSNMALFNISGLCQSLKQYTICFINLLSSECGHLVPRNIIYNMQKHYGGMCSNDAQANTQTMMECANRTMTCYEQLNTSLTSSQGQYNLIRTCSLMENYSSCMHNISRSQPGCADFTRQSLAGLQQFVHRHNAYCGNDNGRTATQCVQSFQDCYSPFNDTFFPGLHTANLTIICSSLDAYAACVTRLSSACSQQFGQMIQSVQTFKGQFEHKCHPDIIKITSCEHVAKCGQVFWTNYSSGKQSSVGLCESIGDYFPCIERSLAACHHPQSPKEVGFGALGTLMKGYCEKLSSNRTFAHCPDFFKCTAATWVSFSPSIVNLFEGSTWCTFLQLSIGCAEQAVQSSACFLTGNVQLRQDIRELDKLRIQTCETDGGDRDNLADTGRQKTAAKKAGGAGSNDPNTSSRCLVVPVLALLAGLSLTFSV